jgi:ribonuclease-3
LRLKRSPDYKRIQKELGIRFLRRGLLKTALTHSSCVAGRRRRSNENLEFLGDAVLELLAREHLYKKYPARSEGELSELKKAYTNEDALFIVGKRLKAGRMLIMDRGEAATGGRKRRSNIAAVMEAIIGAVYLDRGLVYTRRFVRRIILNRRPRIEKDFKSFLNNLAMRRRFRLDYKVVREEGPSHHKVFIMGLQIDGKLKARGRGSNKKKAEQDAARAYLKKTGIRI